MKPIKKIKFTPIKKKTLIKIFLLATGFSILSFFISYCSIQQVIKNEPDILEKIETALTKTYQIEKIQVTLPRDISVHYTQSQDIWKFDLDTKKIKVLTAASNVEVLETQEDALLIKAEGLVDSKKNKRLLDVSFSKAELKIKEWAEDTKDIQIQIYLPAAFKKSLEINTVSGEIEIERNFLEKIKLSSVSGDVSIEQNSVSVIEIETVSGDLSIEFAKNHTPYQFKINTLSGEVTNMIKENLKSGKLISIKTVSGNVEID